MGFRKTASKIVPGLPEDGSPVAVTLELTSGGSMKALQAAAQKAGASHLEVVSDSMLSAQIPQESWPELTRHATIHIKPVQQPRK
jgi:hypothetical protein